MLRWSFLFIFFASLIVGCARPPVNPLPPQNSHKIYKPTAFNRVIVEGDINVSLHTGYKHPQVIFSGDPRDLAYLSTKVVDGVLIITLGNGYPHYGAVKAEIRARSLNSFVYHGMGLITGSKLHSRLLNLIIDNKGRTILGGKINVWNLEVTGGGETQIRGIRSPNLRLKISGKSKVRLYGVINIASLEVNDGSWLSMYWVRSRNLVIREKDHAYLQLAGIVTGRLDVELWDAACFNGRYLRADRAFVKTHDRSVAEISAIQRQHTLATDASNIYFYNISDLRTDFMAFDGSVLDMRNLSLPFVQEYNQYNK